MNQIHVLVAYMYMYITILMLHANFATLYRYFRPHKVKFLILLASQFQCSWQLLDFAYLL